jgi:ubiquinone/menaquinone biosynthesis C-methylase UbiE
MSISTKEAASMSYVDLMAFIGETNRPPGGKNSIRELAINTFINSKSLVLDVGCNTGYCTFEIARLVKCNVIGVDLSQSMISEANRNREADKIDGKLVNFKVADALKLPFQDNTFDLVMSGGSTVFVNSIENAIKEYKRVTKDWGFVGDINFFYHKPAPTDIIKEMNNLMQINIRSWDKEFFLKLYSKADLEFYYCYEGKARVATEDEIKKYCEKIVNAKKLDKEIKEIIIMRLIKIMALFNENQKYLSYGVFILRKRPNREQISLFGL